MAGQTAEDRFFESVQQWQDIDRQAREMESKQTGRGKLRRRMTDQEREQIEKQGLSEAAAGRAARGGLPVPTRRIRPRILTPLQPTVTGRKPIRRKGVRS